MLRFTVTLFGPDEHCEHNTASALWDVIERKHGSMNNMTAMLIGAAIYEPIVDNPPVTGRKKTKLH